MEKKTKVLLAIAREYENKNKNFTDRIESIVLPNELKLNKTLQEKIDDLKDTPIGEPELFKAIKEETALEFKLTLFKHFRLDVDDFDLADSTEAVIAAIKKITDKKDSDGSYKSTPMLDTVKLPRTTQVQELMSIANNKELTNKEIDEKAKSKAYEIAGVKKEDLTKWESELVWEMFLGFVSANTDAVSMRQAFDRTQFARYLKN